MKKQVNFEIDSGQSFFADELTVVHNPTKLIFDFKSVTPRFDMRNREAQPMKVTHHVVVVDIYMAKEIIKILEENVKHYEKRFGKIAIPDAVKKAKSQVKDVKEETIEAPTYFG
ncbi:MAG: DUF3467 domain-containing protein [Nanoarchaeota archaeon]